MKKYELHFRKVVDVHGNCITVEPLYKDTPHKDNQVSKDMDQGPDDICM